MPRQHAYDSFRSDSAPALAQLFYDGVYQVAGHLLK